jgi:hypothetical protein
MENNSIIKRILAYSAKRKNQSKPTTAILNIKPRNELRLPLSKIKRSPISFSQTRNRSNKQQRKRKEKINHK